MARVGLSAASLRDFADATFDAAANATGDGPAASFGILGQTVSVRFGSADLHGALTPAWSDLPMSSPGADAFTVHVVDRASAGDPPSPPWPADAYAPRDEVDGFGDESLEVAYQLTTGTLVLWDASQRVGVFWTRAADQVPLWERAMPLRIVLRWALRDAGLALVHGAAVGDGDRMALLVGPGGSGKSTLALAALAAGWRYVSDDYCAVDPGSLRVAPVTGFAKATDTTMRLLPGLSDIDDGGRTPDGKHVLRVRPDGVGVLGAVVLPQVSQVATPPVRVSAARAMASLAPTSLLQLPGSRDRDRELLSAVVRSAPAHALASGPDPAETLRRLSALLGSG